MTQGLEKILNKIREHPERKVLKDRYLSLVSGITDSAQKERFLIDLGTVYFSLEPKESIQIAKMAIKVNDQSLPALKLMRASLVRIGNSSEAEATEEKISKIIDSREATKAAELPPLPDKPVKKLQNTPPPKEVATDVNDIQPVFRLQMEPEPEPVQVPESAVAEEQSQDIESRPFPTLPTTENSEDDDVSDHSLQIPGESYPQVDEQSRQLEVFRKPLEERDSSEDHLKPHSSQKWSDTISALVRGVEFGDLELEREDTLDEVTIGPRKISDDLKRSFERWFLQQSPDAADTTENLTWEFVNFIWVQKSPGELVAFLRRAQLIYRHQGYWGLYLDGLIACNYYRKVVFEVNHQLSVELRREWAAVGLKRINLAFKYFGQSLISWQPEQGYEALTVQLNQPRQKSCFHSVP